ncbi:MAG TPA: hypothetical protein DEF04_07315 [Clostridiales bacterium]|nr:hypothetical protein [Clostridiales bacterium]
MIHTKWFQGRDNLKDVLEIRKNALYEGCDEDASDIYDDFAFSAVVYEGGAPAGTGRLLFKEGRYFIDNVGVVNEHRGKNYGDLIVRMLVRRAVNMGAEKTYAYVCDGCMAIFENIGFEKVDSGANGRCLMVKTGDVGGGCGK